MKGWLPVPNPTAFTVFGLDIKWYGICLTLGIVMGFVVMYKKAAQRGLNKEHTLDLAIYCVPVGVIFSRLYYVAFEWDRYKDNLGEIFNLRAGGLAIHGAIIGGFGMAAILLVKWKENVFDWIDLAVCGLPLAQAIGRWGNYFNSEAHGVATDLPWAIYADGEWVHPTFLYESLWCFLLFLFLIWWSNHKPIKRGQLICLYMIIYSVERFFVEGLRTDSLWIGKFRQAQVISVGLIICGIIGLFFVEKAYKKQLAAEAEEKAEAENSENNS